MAIALNRGNITSTRTTSLRARGANAVPSASVWEPSLREPRVNNVRTLASGTRTVRRNNFEHDYFIEENSSYDGSSQAASVRSSLVLGGVFGLAIFIGTLFAGFNTADETVPQEVSAVSSLTVGEDYPR